MNDTEMYQSCNIIQSRNLKSFEDSNEISLKALQERQKQVWNIISARLKVRMKILVFWEVSKKFGKIKYLVSTLAKKKAYRVSIPRCRIVGKMDRFPLKVEILFSSELKCFEMNLGSRILRPVQDTFKKYLDSVTFKILSEKNIRYRYF